MKTHNAKYFSINAHMTDWAWLLESLMISMIKSYKKNATTIVCRMAHTPHHHPLFPTS